MSTTRPAGIFIWYELMTADSAAAIEFYSHVVGWTAAAMPSSGVPYTLLSSGGVNAGGVLQLSPEMCAAGVPECWIGYIGVADVDAARPRTSRPSDGSRSWPIRTAPPSRS